MSFAEARAKEEASHSSSELAAVTCTTGADDCLGPARLSLRRELGRGRKGDDVVTEALFAPGVDEAPGDGDSENGDKEERNAECMDSFLTSWGRKKLMFFIK